MTNNIQTPFFLIHKDTLDTQLDMLNKALENHWPNSVVGYSYKTNTLPWVIDYANRRNLFAEVVSDDEYNLGKHIGVDPDRFIYNGPIKSKETFLEALENGSYVNIDAQREIDWLKELKRDRAYNLGIRVNFDLEACCPGHTQCPEEGGRFGFCYENGVLAQAIREIQSLGLPVKGLHMHTSTKTRALDVYKVLARKACEIAGEYQLDLSFVDIGGGFFGGMPSKPQFDDYIRQISNILQTTFVSNALVYGKFRFFREFFNCPAHNIPHFLNTGGDFGKLHHGVVRIHSDFSFQRKKIKRLVSKSFETSLENTIPAVPLKLRLICRPFRL